MSASARQLAEGLVPAVRSACEDRLGEITWFRTDWQRGGAATGESTFRTDHDTDVPVVIKYPVGEKELRWTRRLQADDAPVIPRLYASGTEIGGYDFAWLIIEHLPAGPLGMHWDDANVERVADAAARFHKATSAYPVDRVPVREDWSTLAKRGSEVLRQNDVPDKSLWKEAMKRFRKHLHTLADAWHEHEPDQWIHGDLHLANAMCRDDRDDADVVLIDLAEVRAGHWIEDAVYLERQLWARPERLKATRPVKAIANARKHHGLTVDAEYTRLAMI
ncbi:MAG: aminoglycoside phosphotransferase family protein, partial [Planctomycetota bacterium]